MSLVKGLGSEIGVRGRGSEIGFRGSGTEFACQSRDSEFWGQRSLVKGLGSEFWGQRPLVKGLGSEVTIVKGPGSEVGDAGSEVRRSEMAGQRSGFIDIVRVHMLDIRPS
jgi:hypothetical protein